MPEAGRVLVTGADGYLGRLLCVRLLEAGERVLAWVRAGGAEERRLKEDALRSHLAGHAGGVVVASGDLGAADPFAEVDPAVVAAIVHSAAVTRFNVDRETAERVNVEGTRKLLDFAERCPRLESLALMSTVYAAGLRTGRVEEAPLGDAGFANQYEWSKWSAEQELLARHGGLPWRIFRIATVIADGEDGQVTQYNAVHNTLRLLYYGLISTLPGRPGTPVYLVTGDFVADAVVALMRGSPLRRVYHVCRSRAGTLTLLELVDLAFEAFEADPAFARRRVMKPLFVDEEAFSLLTDALTTFSGGIVNQAVSSVAPFARQLYLAKDVDNRNLAAALAGYREPDPAALVRNTCAQLVRTRWGREAPAGPEAAA